MNIPFFVFKGTVNWRAGHLMNIDAKAGKNK